MTDISTLAAGERSTTKLGPKVAARMDGGNIILRRWAGAWIDFVVLPLVAAPLLLPAMGDSALTDFGLVAGLLAALAYFPITEGVWGRSAGKLITGTIVVNEDGDPPGIPKALVRTLLRLVEVNPFLMGGVPAGLCVVATKHHQRLGDLLANTYVVPFKALKVAGVSQAPTMA